MKRWNDGTKFMFATLVIIVILLLTQSCKTPEQYFARMEAKEAAYLKRIAADTLARPVQNRYSPGVLLNGWVPRYNNGYWYNGFYYDNNIYGPRPLIRLNSNRYVVPYRKSIKRRKKYVNRSTNRNTRTRRVPTQTKRVIRKRGN